MPRRAGRHHRAASHRGGAGPMPARASGGGARSPTSWLRGYAGTREPGPLHRRGLPGAACSGGFGLPVLEAMACGAPVITSSSSSLPGSRQRRAVLVDTTPSTCRRDVPVLANADAREPGARPQVGRRLQLASHRRADVACSTTLPGRIDGAARLTGPYPGHPGSVVPSEPWLLHSSRSSCPPTTSSLRSRRSLRIHAIARPAARDHRRRRRLEDETAAIVDKLVAAGSKAFDSSGTRSASRRDDSHEPGQCAATSSSSRTPTSVTGLPAFEPILESGRGCSATDFTVAPTASSTSGATWPARP